MATHQTKMRWSADLDVECQSEMVHDCERKMATCFDHTSVNRGRNDMHLSISACNDECSVGGKCLNQRRVSLDDNEYCDGNYLNACCTNHSSLRLDTSDGQLDNGHISKNTAQPPSIIVQCRNIYTAIGHASTTDHTQLAGRLLAQLSVTQGEAKAVEAATRGQSACEAWYFHRRGRITASNFAKVVDCVKFEYKKGSVVKKLLEDIRYPTSTWGLEHEKTALDAYKSRISSYHGKLKLNHCGFVINPQFPHLGASPDSWVECMCCGVGVVEVKCPFPALRPRSTSKCSFHFLNPHQKAMPCCPSSLPRDHVYYCQVQGQIAVCDVQYCDFVCWSPDDIHVERITRDDHFIHSIKKDLDSFYECNMIPAILSLVEGLA
ncbi:uncharacterized protein [Haliotis asinina]|uniref:uncharacterized protein n=1 Tax=Haliotis asinina TaxID=109174 RepID=UPI003531DEF8